MESQINTRSGVTINQRCAIKMDLEDNMQKKRPCKLIRNIVRTEYGTKIRELRFYLQEE